MVVGEVFIQVAVPDEVAAGQLKLYALVHANSRYRWLNLLSQPVPGRIRRPGDASPEVGLIVSTALAAAGLWEYAAEYAVNTKQLGRLEALKEEGDDLPPEECITLETPVDVMGYHADITGILRRANLQTTQDVVDRHYKHGGNLGLKKLGDNRAARVSTLLRRHKLIPREDQE